MAGGVRLEKLNLRAPKAYDYSNYSETEETKVFYYCVSEGATEESYFYGIRNNKVELKIKGEVHIEVVEKQEGQETLSHPLQLVHACLVQMGREDSEGNEIPKEQWKENCKWKDYDDKIDKVCVIFDRDYRNLEESLQTIFDLCNKHGIKIILSNPNFELWLLMHFPNIEQYPAEMLLENKKNLRHQIFADASKNKKYLEILVAKNAEGYSKGSKIKFDRFLSLVDVAVEQAKFFCEDSEHLINELGTSVGRLIEEMRDS